MDSTTKLESLHVWQNGKVPYEGGDRIGKGNCIVYKARKKRSRFKGLLKRVKAGNQDDMEDWPYAQKSIELEDDVLDSAMEAFQQEVKILIQAQHHHVIEYIDAYAVKTDSPRLELIMGRGETDLSKFLSKDLKSGDRGRLRQWFTCLLCSVNYIHGLGIRHRDIKPANIIIKAGKVLLADFGISKMGLGQTLSTTVPGWGRGRSEPYCAPEVDDGSSRGRAADIFSLGAVFLEMLITHSYPEQRKNLDTVLQHSGTPSFAKRLDEVHEWMDCLEEQMHNMPNEWQHEILSICRDMMKRDRDDRPHASALWNGLHSLLPSGGLSPPSCSCMRSVSLTNEAKLIDACKCGSLQTVQKLVQDGTNLKTIGAIHQAATCNSRDIVQYFIDRGVNVNLRDYSYQTALHCAAGYGHEGVVEMLLSHGATATLPDIEGRTALHYAAGCGHTNIVRMLLDVVEREDRSDYLAKDQNGQTALHCAAKRGQKDSVRLLLDSKPQAVKLEDAKKRTALHFAAGYGCPEVVRLLLDKKADYKAQDDSRWTTLHFVARGSEAKPRAGRYEEVAEMLLACGADATEIDDHGFTPYYILRNRPSALRDLLQRAMNAFEKSVRAVKVQIPMDGAENQSNSLSHPSTSGNSSVVAVPPGRHDLISFLALVQSFKVDILPITWQPQLGRLGTGASGLISQSFITLRISLAFKRFKGVETLAATAADMGVAPLEEAFRCFATELRVLREPWVRRQENVIDLLGICFEAKYADGVLWPVLVFEKAPFGNLRQFLDSELGERLTLQTKLGICQNCVLALATMHGCNVVHGDLKPENILIFDTPEGGFLAKVIDFSFSHAGAKETNMTYLPCTPPWEAPEYRRGPIQVRDAKRADIYSLGLVCLWLLFRRYLFEYWQQHAEPYGNSYRDLQRNDEKGLCKLKIEDNLLAFANRHLPSYDWPSTSHLRRVEQFLSSCLTRRREDRPLDLWRMFNLVANTDYVERPKDMDLWMKTITRNPGVDGDSEGFGTFHITESLPQLIQADYRLRRQLVDNMEERVRQGCLNNVYELAFCKAIGFGTQRDILRANELVLRSSKSMFELEMEIDRVRTGRMTLKFQEKFMELFNGGLIQRLNPEANDERGLMHIRDAYRDEIADLESALGRTSEVVIQLKQHLAGILLQNGEFEQAEHLYLEIQGALAENTNQLPDFPPTWEPFNPIHRDAWKYRREQATDGNIRRALTNQLDLGAVRRHRGNLGGAEDLETNALEATKRLDGEENIGTTIVMESLAKTYAKQGKWTAAERLEDKVLASRQKFLGANHHLTLQSKTMLASIYGCVQSCRKFREADALPVAELPKKQIPAEKRRQHRWNKAACLLESVLQTGGLILGRDHAVMVDAEAALAWVYYSQRKWDMAETLERGVLEKRTEMLGSGHADTLTTRGNLASLLKRRGALDEAEVYESDVFETKKRVLGPEHPDTLVGMSNLANTLASLRRVEDASILWEELRMLRRESRRKLLEERNAREHFQHRRSRLPVLQKLLDAEGSLELAPEESKVSKDVGAWFIQNFGADPGAWKVKG